MCYASAMPTRCPWSEKGGQLYLDYHDTEWGVPCHNDRTLFEFIVLESAQAGLSWLTILKRREQYARAFAHFDAVQVAQFTQKDIENLLLPDSGIIRNRTKIAATITNAQAFFRNSAGIWLVCQISMVVCAWPPYKKCVG